MKFEEWLKNRIVNEAIFGPRPYSFNYSVPHGSRFGKAPSLLKQIAGYGISALGQQSQTELERMGFQPAHMGGHHDWGAFPALFQKDDEDESRLNQVQQYQFNGQINPKLTPEQNAEQIKLNTEKNPKVIQFFKNNKIDPRKYNIDISYNDGKNMSIIVTYHV